MPNDKRQEEAMTNQTTKCKYPDWEGGLIVGEHKFDKDGFCIICGEKNQ